MPANTTNFLESRLDLADKYLGYDDGFILYDLLTEAGKEIYISGGAWAWGINSNGQLGIGNIFHRSSPVQIGSLTNWKQVSGADAHSLAVKTDGTLWAWGNNEDFGQLGDGTTSSRSSPVQIGSLTGWSQVSGGRDHSLAVKTDGTLWAWGGNNFGQLGDGTITHKSSPVQIGSLTGWKQVSGGGNHSLAVKTDGTLWAWGRNASGRLGDGTTTSRSSPVQIGILTNWKQVSGSTEHSLAVKTDGTLWAWGYNRAGQLGDGTITHRSSPVQIGSLTGWSQVSAGIGFSVDGVIAHSLALKTDGTLWAWGSNGNGQLGDGTRTHRSSPVQVGSLTGWSQVSGGRGHSLATKADGTLWAWGLNADGQLGNGTRTGISSPAQIGSLINWRQVSAGGRHSLAIKG